MRVDRQESGDFSAVVENSRERGLGKHSPEAEETTTRPADAEIFDTESSGVLPVLESDVFSIGTRTAVDSDTADLCVCQLPLQYVMWRCGGVEEYCVCTILTDETNNGDDFDGRENKLGLAVDRCRETVEGDNDDKCDGDPHGVVDLGVGDPVVHEDGDGDESGVSERVRAAIRATELAGSSAGGRDPSLPGVVRQAASLGLTRQGTQASIE